MILGYQITLLTIIYLGLLTFLLVAFQMLVGLRVIKFKGRLHLKVHRRGAWALVAVGAVHGLLALVAYNGWSILS